MLTALRLVSTKNHLVLIKRGPHLGTRMKPIFKSVICMWLVFSQRFSFVFICGSCSHSVSRSFLYAARVPTAALVCLYMRLVFPQRFSFVFICGSCSHSVSRLSLYAARVPTAFLVRPNFVSCFFNLMETRRNRLSTSETIGLG